MGWSPVPSRPRTRGGLRTLPCARTRNAGSKRRRPSCGKRWPPLPCKQLAFTAPRSVRRRVGVVRPARRAGRPRARSGGSGRHATARARRSHRPSANQESESSPPAPPPASAPLDSSQTQGDASSGKEPDSSTARATRRDRRAADRDEWLSASQPRLAERYVWASRGTGRFFWRCSDWATECLADC
eukprot:scaffold10559_cov78-Isochrysis_galbana.AAC.2